MLRTTDLVRSGRRSADRRTYPAHRNDRWGEPQRPPGAQAEGLPPCADVRLHRGAVPASKARNRMLGKSEFPALDPFCPGAYRRGSVPRFEFFRLHSHRPTTPRIGDRGCSCRRLSSPGRPPSSNSMHRNGMFHSASFCLACPAIGYVSSGNQRCRTVGAVLPEPKRSTRR